MTHINSNDEWRVTSDQPAVECEASAASDQPLRRFVQRENRRAVIADAAGVDGTCSDSACPCHQWSRQEPTTTTPTTATDQQSLWADAATIRAALMDVVDAGDPEMAGRIWFFYERINGMNIWSEDFANKQRVGFADAVLRRLAELQSPPHNAPRLDTLCPTHIRRRLTPYDGWCTDCTRERKESR
jgi:hypothetical protein